MKITIEDEKDVGSCCFCERGELDGDKIIRPYSRVYKVEKSFSCCLTVRLCAKCIRELYQNLTINDVFKPEHQL